MRNIYKDVQNKYRILENSLQISSKELFAVYVENETIKPSCNYLETHKTDLHNQTASDFSNTNHNDTIEHAENPVVQNMSIQSVGIETKIGVVNNPNIEEVSVESVRDVEELLNDQVIIEKIDGDIVTECEKIVSNKLSVVIEANPNNLDEHELQPAVSTMVRKRKRFSRPKINL